MQTDKLFRELVGGEYNYVPLKVNVDMLYSTSKGLSSL